jgi:RNA polymerase sigma factor (sigma-70 family)
MPPDEISSSSVERGASDGAGGPESDARVLRRFASGDRHALTSIIAQHEVAVRRVLLGLWDDRHEVDDLCQEVFLRLIERPPVLTSAQSLAPWLYRTAVNIVRDRARRRRVRQWFRLVGSTSQRAASTLEDPRSKPQRDEDVDLLRDEIQRLGPALRETIVLRDLIGLTPGEAADILGITSKTVTDRLYRARRELARRLESRGQRDAL